MKRIALRLIAAIEAISGFAGLGLVVCGVVGKVPYEVVPVLWFGIFPLASLIAGVLLWLRGRNAVALSIIVQLLQIPFIYTGGVLLNLGVPLNLTINGVWNSHDGGYPTVLGVNFLALGMLLILLWSRSVLREVPAVDTTANDAIEQNADQI